MNEKEIKKGLRSDIVLSELAETKIQDAYEKIRRESGNKDTKETIVRINHRNRKKFIVITAAAILALGTTLGTVASNRFFSLTQNDDEVLFVFNYEDYELCGDRFLMELTYLPEGYKEKGGKYHKDTEDPNVWSGISYVVENTLYWSTEAIRSDAAAVKKIWNVKEVEETQINGMDAYLFTRKKSHGVYYNVAFLFNSEEGYIVTLFTTGDIPKEEVKKIAQGVKVTNTGEKVPDIEEELKILEDANAKSEPIQIVAYDVDPNGENNPERFVCRAEDMAQIGEPFVKEIDGEQVEFTVQSARYVESCSEYAPKYFENYEEEVLPFLNEDGTVKPYWRQPLVFGEDLDVDKEEQAEQTFLEVKIHAKNLSNEELYGGFYMRTLSLEKDGDVYLSPEIEYLPVADYIPHEFQIYFDARENFDGINGLKQSLWRTMQPKEELDYTILMLVDKDQMDQTYLEVPIDSGTDESTFVDLGLAQQTP